MYIDSVCMQGCVYGIMVLYNSLGYVFVKFQLHVSGNETDNSSDPDADWKERLANEASDEFAEQSGAYQEGW